MPRWSELVIPTTLVSCSASQPAATRSLSLEARLPRSADALLSQCRTPVPRALAPHLLQPKSTTILSVTTSEDFQLSTPKPPISCTLEPLTASVPHLPLPSLSPKHLPVWLCAHHNAPSLSFLHSLWLHLYPARLPTLYRRGASPAGVPTVLLVLTWLLILCPLLSLVQAPTSCQHSLPCSNFPPQPTKLTSSQDFACRRHCRTLLVLAKDFKIWTQVMLAQNLPGSALKKLKISHIQE